MLSWIIEKTVATVSSTVGAVGTVCDYVADDIFAIPEAIEKGWDEGLLGNAAEKRAESSAESTGDATEEHA